MPHIVNTIEMWENTCRTILERGERVTARGLPTLEVIGHRTTWDMCYPVMSLIKRGLNYKFMAAEALWILRGSNDLSYLLQFCNKMSAFSDDGLTLSGAYGPPVVDQLPYCVDAITHDNCTRQAVLTIWRPRPGPSRDIPCTVSMQFLLRDGGLHCVVNMRSSDVYLGLPYDVFTFSMIAMQVGLRLRSRGIMSDPGYLTIMVGSQHIYERDRENVWRCLTGPMEYEMYQTFDYASLTPHSQLVMLHNMTESTSICVH